MEVELVRHDATPEDKCDTANDQQQTHLPAGSTHTQLQQPFCLEKNQRYEVKLTFTQYNPSAPKGAKILIDSVSNNNTLAKSVHEVTHRTLPRWLCSRMWTTFPS